MKHHQVQYVEFLSNDFTKVKEFYSQAFGWEFVDYGPSYIAFEGEHVSGGFGEGKPVAGSVLVIVYSSDLEASQKAVEAAGGKIVQKIFSFPGGRRFQFADLEGNELAVWSDV